MNEWRLWFDNRLDNAIEAAEVEAKIESGESIHRIPVHLFSSRMIVIRFSHSQLFFDCCRAPLVSGECQ